jgi:hypothetical protein
MATRIKLRGGAKSALPSSNLLEREPLVTTDTGNLYIATGTDTKLTVTPDVGALATLSALDLDNDHLMVHDASEASAKAEKKVSLSVFKEALNIPEASTDEKTAASSGGTAGYLGGTDGTDGVLRTDSSLSATLEEGGSVLRLSVVLIDGGTFA